jgi:hypothetical protein
MNQKGRSDPRGTRPKMGQGSRGQGAPTRGNRGRGTGSSNRVPVQRRVIQTRSSRGRLKTVALSPGTESSNPSPSSGESGANRVLARYLATRYRGPASPWSQRPCISYGRGAAAALAAAADQAPQAISPAKTSLSCTAGSQKPPSSAKNRNPRKPYMRRVPWNGSPSRRNCAEPPSAPLAARRPAATVP